MVRVWAELERRHVRGHEAENGAGCARNARPAHHQPLIKEPDAGLRPPLLRAASERGEMRARESDRPTGPHVLTCIHPAVTVRPPS
jgi:hypothetical protein